MNSLINYFCVYPSIIEQHDLARLYQTVQTTISLTPQIPIKIFYDNFVSKYQTQIENDEQDFFLSLEISYEPINKLKIMYSNSSSHNKKIIWKYIRTLTQLAIKYWETQQDID